MSDYMSPTQIHTPSTAHCPLAPNPDILNPNPHRLTRIIHKPSPPALTPFKDRLLNDRLPPRRPLASNDRTEDLDLLDLVLVFLFNNLTAPPTNRAGAAASADAAVAAARDTAAGAGIGVVAADVVAVAVEKSACGGGAGVGDVEHGAFEGGAFALGEDKAGGRVEGCGFVVDGR